MHEFGVPHRQPVRVPLLPTEEKPQSTELYGIEIFHHSLAASCRPQLPCEPDQRYGKRLIPAIIPKKFNNAALLLKVNVVLGFFPHFIHCSLPFTDCLQHLLILNFYTLLEEKYVGSKLILFLTYGEIPVMFNLDHQTCAFYREQKRILLQPKCVMGVPYCFVAGILDNKKNDEHVTFSF